MATTRENAQKMLQLFEVMRHAPPGPAFRRVTELELSFTHLRTMGLLLPDKTLAMKELAEHLSMTPPSVTALTRRLVQTGLVRRQNHPQDQRVVLLSLTDEGRELMEQLNEGRVRGMELLLEGLTPEDQRLFIELLERAVHAMTTAPAQADDSKDDH